MTTEHQTQPRRGSRVSRVLHVLLALVVINQLVMSQFMHVSNPARGRAGNVWWEFHEYGGLLAFVILVAYWVWATIRRGEVGLGNWFPWFSGARLKALGADIKLYAQAAMRLRLPPPGKETPLADAVQGLGMILVSYMAISGTIFWLVRQAGASKSETVHWLMEIHGALGNVVWFYLGLHAGAAIVHEFFGQPIVRSMSPFRR